MLLSIMVLGGLALIFGAILGYAAVRFKVEGNPVVEKINDVLPQSQCGRCNYLGCRAYAEAIAKGEASINLCTPGGELTMLELAKLLDRSPQQMIEVEEALPSLAVIDENRCIGCTLCAQACPVDAIVGAVKFMHTVIAKECTGCALCVPPCPVDCIVMQPQPLSAWRYPYPIQMFKIEEKPCN
jgi:Na+-translocating ferredoxin:NAD+ oxidoreductase subunit B